MTDNTMQWQNASQTLSASPATYRKVADRADVVESVEEAIANGQKVRVTGGRHSWYPLVLTDEAVNGQPVDDSTYMMIDFGEMTTVTKEVTDAGLHLVHAQPGATMGDLEVVTSQDSPENPAVALPTNGVIPTEIQLGGFISAGCHGTGWTQPTVADLVYEIEMVVVASDKSVSVRTFSETNPDDPMDVVRVALGTIGVITKITFKAEPLFKIHGVDTVSELLSDVISRNPSAQDHSFKTLVESTDYLELFWFPFNATTTNTSLDLLIDVPNTKVWKKQGNVVPTSTPDRGIPSQAWDDLETQFGQTVYTQIAERSSGSIFERGEVEGLLKAMSTFAYLQAPDDYVAPATRFYHYQTSAFPVLDFSFALPLDPIADPYYQAFSKAWYAVVDLAALWAETKPFESRYPVNVALHARFIKNSQSLLSPAYQPADSETHTCWIEFLAGAPIPADPEAVWYRNYNESWGDFCREVGRTWLALGGRPHWAKQWQQLDTPDIDIYGKLSVMYGENLASFKTVRDELDPTNTFLYPWTEKIFP